ncbi:MAG: TolC family protein [Muribaculaceae bacterium]|jgi:outer membrane protein|nr:TolC family protein [Muribaculaceae bacterium]
MKVSVKHVLLFGLMMASISPIWADGSTLASSDSLPAAWSYSDCVNYARSHNIKLQQSVLTRKSSAYDTEAAKAQLFPTLEAATTQSYTNYPSPQTGNYSNNYNGSYGLNAGWTLYDGSKRSNTIKKSQLQEQINDLSIDEINNNLETEILSDYLQILYAKESIDIAEKTMEISKAQKDRAYQLMKAGKTSRVDYTQLESQYQADLYSVVEAKSNYDSKKMALKQLLELGIGYDLNLDNLTFTDAQVLQSLPDKTAVYNTALGWMPSFKSNQLQQNMSDLNVNIAKSTAYPQITLNGSVGTSNASHTGYNFGDQLKNGLHEQIGVTLSVPIFDQKTTKTNVAKAQIDKLNAQLDYHDLANTLSQNVESAYIDARSAQAKYLSGKESVKSAALNDELTNEQFKIGLVNTLELLTSHNKLLTAQQELLQSKYMAILNIKMLDYYQNKPITLP